MTRPCWKRRRSLRSPSQQLAFSDITAVIVEQKTRKDTEPAGTSMSRSMRTVYRKSYTLSLRRAGSQVVLPEGKIAVPHYALDLPMKERNDPLSLEAAARQLSQLGGWPAWRRGYALSAGSENAPSAYAITSMPHDSETSIGAE